MSLPAPAARSTAVVTGASSGIGEALARELARRGHGVTLVARRGQQLAVLAAELELLGVKVHVLATDLSDPRARAELPGRVEQLGLDVSILVNNAGVMSVGPVANSDPMAELRVVEVDVAAVVDLCSRFLPSMVASGSGAILNVSSIVGFQPVPGQATYGAAKAFVLSYSRALRAELRGTGITVTALCPGPVATEISAIAGVSDAELDASVPKSMWVSADTVARVGIASLHAGRGVVIPGAANKLVTVITRATPKPLLAAVLARRQLTADRHRLSSQSEP